MARLFKKRNFTRRVAIVGDGFTEKIYFEQLKEFEHIKGVDIKPELPNKISKGGTYKKAINTAKFLADEGYDQVYCLIDFDTVISENKVALFLQELKNINKEAITVYINNPCFETWVLLHFEKTGKSYADCNTVGNAISKHLKDYQKSIAYLQKKNLYKILRPNLEINAIPNAAFLESNRKEKSIEYPRAEIFKFFLKEKIVNQKK